MKNLVKAVADMYADACFLDAIATWDDDESVRDKADAAWNQYNGAKRVLAMVFRITEDEVDRDMEVIVSEGA